MLVPTSRQLETFLAVASQGSLRGAADYLGISQPSISKQLIALERKLGQPLFERRRGSKAVLSSFGVSLLDAAGEMLERQRKLGLQPGNQGRPEKVTVLVRYHLFSRLEPWLEDLRVEGAATRLNFEIVEDHSPFEERVAADPGTIAVLRSAHTSLQTSIPSSPVLRELLMVNLCSVYRSVAGESGDLLLPILLPQLGEFSSLVRTQLKAQGVQEEHLLDGSPFVGTNLRQVLDGHGAGVFMDHHVEHLVASKQLVKLNFCLPPLYLLLISNPRMEAPLRDRIRKKLVEDLLVKADQFPATS